MAEIVSSAVVGETMNRMVSSLIGKHEEEFGERDNIERLEMAHIKMEAALEMSNKWQITNTPLLRWQSKLKRASQECDDTLHHCKQRALEDEEIRQGVSLSSFPKRIAHATKSFISSFISRSNDESSSSSVNVRRFERFADGANEFLKFVEFGGTPRQYMFFNPLIGHLLTGKTKLPSIARKQVLLFGYTAHELCGSWGRGNGRVCVSGFQGACKEFQSRIHAASFREYRHIWDRNQVHAVSHTSLQVCC